MPLQKPSRNGPIGKTGKITKRGRAKLLSRLFFSEETRSYD
jgi:hypothetical protein